MIRYDAGSRRRGGRTERRRVRQAGDTSGRVRGSSPPSPATPCPLTLSRIDMPSRLSARAVECIVPEPP